MIQWKAKASDCQASGPAILIINASIERIWIFIWD